MLLGYSSSIGEVLKNIRRQYAFFRGPNIDHMKKIGGGGGGGGGKY